MMNILSPCFIATLIILVYFFMPKPYQSKVKTFVNKNQNVIIGALILAGLYYFNNFEGIHIPEHSSEEEEQPSCGG